MSLAEHDTFVATLRAYGATMENAEARWRALQGQRPGALPLAEPEPEDAAALEKATQWEVVKLFRAMGGDVCTLSQPRRTKQTPGLPDLWVFMPRHRFAFWWETKRPVGGRLSPAQVHFAEQCAATDTPWGTGSKRDAEDYLIQQRLAYRTPTGEMEPLNPSDQP